eukprot:1213701-Alexandrium_andersonii.AAC.1
MPYHGRDTCSFCGRQLEGSFISVQSRRTFRPPCAGAATLMEEVCRLSPRWGLQATAAASDLLGAAASAVWAVYQEHGA